MSRLDYITIAIVSVCILAILFLVYKMTNIFKGEVPDDVIETVADTSEFTDDIYDYQIRPEDDTLVAENPNSPVSNPGSVSTTSDTRSATGTTSGTTTDRTATPGNTTTTSSNEPSSPVYTGEGKYLVLAGAFTKRSLADKEAERIRQKGYSNARVEIFDRGKHAVILVDRFTNMAEAERLAKQLTTDGVKCYVKIKEGS